MPVPNFRNWKLGKDGPWIHGAKPKRSVQAQGSLIRREDYIAVTRVGLGGRLDRNSPRPASLRACTFAGHRIDQEWLGTPMPQGNAGTLGAQSFACTIPDLHHWTCDVGSMQAARCEIRFENGYVCLESDLKPRVKVIPRYRDHHRSRVGGGKNTPRQAFGRERQRQGTKGDESLSGSLPPGIVGNEKVPCIFLDNYRHMRLDHAAASDLFVFDPITHSFHLVLCTVRHPADIS